MSPASPVYLDHAATTPMHPAAIEAMTAVLATVGNASSLHTSGRTARRRMEESRESIAAALGARPSEVIFTAGGTESDNLAVKGIFWARRDADARRRRVVTTAVEHHAVLDAVQWLGEHEDAEITYLPTEADGSVTPAALRAVLEEHGADVALVSIMWANNEVGTIMPITELAAVAAEFDVPMHTDAVQAAGQIPVSFADSGCAAMSITAHKFGGPTGMGALLLRRDTACVPLAHGGGQERDVRSGTPDVAGAVAMAEALRIAVEGMSANSARLRALRDRLIEGVLAEIDDVVVNGSLVRRLPGNAHFTFRGCEGDSLLMLLDANGIECSTGSACTAGVAQTSHVLLAMGADPETSRGSIRLSLGHTSVDADVDAALSVLPAAVLRARQAALASSGSVR
ncbi:cysteine desulfurase family protein [Mycobacterium sp. ACS4331]|uniref:cysteine desulfurase family protein n=1 Tax=Mycobacterium sp. ACS4331 TaxID=1834121 RepID=UPI0007FD10E1|nr:cysteine desulfurase family protein [Mycobacterium sp. ACS4331]OBF18885.1 cysteine desulfurase [Mycobacterium sp. ACS4331]